MSYCREYTEALVITAIPVSDISAAAVSSPANCLAPYITKSGFSPTLAHAVTIGSQKETLPYGTGHTTARWLVPIRGISGKARDDESDAVAGRLHTVTVTCEVDDRELAVRDYLLALERTPSHLLLTFRDGSRAFVSATADSYLMTVDRDGAKTSVTFRIQCLMGVQLIA